MKPCGKINEDWIKCFEIKIDKFSNNYNCKLELFGFDGPNFLLKQDFHLYWISMDSINSFESLYCSLYEGDTKQRIIYSCCLESNRNTIYNVFSTNDNQYNILKIPITNGIDTCSFQSSSFLENEISLPPSSFSMVSTCLAFHTSNDQTTITFLGTIEKEIITSRKGIILKCFKLDSVPVKISIFCTNPHPVREEYLVVHTSDRKITVISLTDFSIVKGR